MTLRDAMDRLHNVADKLNAARAGLHDSLSGIEDEFAGISPYPASIPIYEFLGRVARSDRGYKMPVAHLHFEEGHLSFSVAPRPYHPPAHLGKSGCRRCGSGCQRCKEQDRATQRRWEEREAANAKPVDVLEIDDPQVLLVVVKALPDMRKRLIEDSKVTPEDIEEAIAAVRKFLDDNPAPPPRPPKR